MRLVTLILSTLITLYSSKTLAQDGIILNSEEATQSYTLLSNGDATYLIDNCGQIINEWRLRQSLIDNHTKFLDNGNMYYISNNRLYETDWEDNDIKILEHNIPNLMMEYEAILLPSGNYLCLARYIEDSNFFDSNGYNSDLGFPSYDDAVVELDAETGSVVWEWRISDHIIQERNPFLANYGIIDQNPGKFNLDAILTNDWFFDETFMINGMDYNPELDQIALSVRKIGEVVIIDHSTTTAEAKTDSGGNYGKGGEPLYRWGNPQNYGEGTAQDRVLYFQHNPNWILHGEHKGKIMIYNNHLDNPTQTDFDNRYSDILILDPDMNLEGSYNKTVGQPYQPLQAEVVYSGETMDFFSDYTSGAVVMPNGNIFVTEGKPGFVKEYSPDRRLLWQYNIFDARYIFRAEKYPIEHPAFIGKDLSPKGTITLESSNDYDCNITAIEDLAAEKVDIEISQNATQVELYIDGVEFGYQLFTPQGQLIDQNLYIRNNSHLIDKSTFATGIYFLRISTDNFIETQAIFLL